MNPATRPCHRRENRIVPSPVSSPAIGQTDGSRILRGWSDSTAAHHFGGRLSIFTVDKVLDAPFRTTAPITAGLRVVVYLRGGMELTAAGLPAIAIEAPGLLLGLCETDHAREQVFASGPLSSVHICAKLDFVRAELRIDSLAKALGKPADKPAADDTLFFEALRPDAERAACPIELSASDGDHAVIVLRTDFAMSCFLTSPSKQPSAVKICRLFTMPRTSLTSATSALGYHAS